VNNKKIFLLLTIGRDIRLLKQWLEYYSQWQFDGVLISVHDRPEWSDKIMPRIQALVSEYGAVIADVHKDIDYALEERRNRMLARYCSSSDWMVLADVDEFHHITKSPQELVDYCESKGYDYIAGRFLDRVDAAGGFPEIDESKSIWDSYPVGVQLTRNVVRATYTKVILARCNLKIPTGQHIARGVACPLDEVNVAVHHFKWDASVFDRSRYMVWLYSMQGEPWFMEPRRFLNYAGSDRKLDLSDPALEAFWPCIHRKGKSDTKIMNGCGDPLRYIPEKNISVTVSHENENTILVNQDNGRKFRVDKIVGMLWDKCDGSRLMHEILTEVLATTIKTSMSWEDAEKALQYIIRELAGTEFLHNVEK
jgi:hypothetical protein